MSKLAVKGHDSGTGTVTLEAPNTSTDRTITLPDTTGTMALTSDIPTSITDNGDATAITINSAENVGFGATPTSFYSGYTGVQIGGNGTLYGQTAAGANNNFWMSQNVRAGTDGSEKAITTGVSSQVMLANGEVVAKVAPSASADANVSWTTAMTIKNDASLVAQQIPKAWCHFDASSGTPTDQNSHGVSSLSDYGVGFYAVNWSSSFSNANACTVASGVYSSSGRREIVTSFAQDAGSAVVNACDYNGTNQDVGILQVVAFGDYS